MSTPFTVAIFGAGKIGETITALLSRSGRYSVKVCDQDGERAKRIAKEWKNASGWTLDASDSLSIQTLLSGCHAVISALPFYHNVCVATLARAANVHYFDLTEDVETSAAVSKLAEGASSYLMPQCGLAPGFISVAAMHLVRTFEKVDTVKMRVGALPIYPSNYLKYNLTWSTEGLINEYGNMCWLIEGGQKRTAFALEGYERFSLDGDEYEAFNTSGGLGTLCETLAGQVRNLDYKSVRYPGHRDFIAFLMNDLRFNEDRATLKAVFERSISTTAQDKCLILVEVRGYDHGRFVQRTYASTVYNTNLDGHHFGAIQITTASGICTPLDLLLTGAVKVQPGFVRAEQIPLDTFLANEFGSYYKDEKAMRGIFETLKPKA